MAHLSAQRVTSADGTEIAVFESGNPDGPVLVAVHGYPDNHTVWDPIAAELGDRYRVVTYDVRGAGASGKPTARAAYRIERLTEDFAAVIDAVSPDAPVHLLGHDWGAIQSWGPVNDPRFGTRIASYTSISGPCLHYVGAWMRDRSHPMASLRQVLHSWYIAAFQIPWLPERVVSRAGVDAGIARAELRAGGGTTLRNPVTRSTADKVNGIKLYRANMPRILARPRAVPTSIPVQVVAPTHDPFVSIPIATRTPVPYVEDLTVHQVDGSHWVVSEDPGAIAALVDTFATARSATSAAPARGKRARR
ncbi:MAG: alpha/beta fold hydrolase [Marmoricola sp.]